jgi:hypothetical protein
VFIKMEFLVIFGAPWNKQGRWMLSGTGVSGCKSKDLLPLLTLYDFQRSNDQVIEEVHSYVSCWLAKVASTRVAGLTAKRLDPLSMAMRAIPDQGVDVGISDPGVRASSVRASEALSVHPLRCASAAFDLTPGADRRRHRPHH